MHAAPLPPNPPTQRHSYLLGLHLGFLQEFQVCHNLQWKQSKILRFFEQCNKNNTPGNIVRGFIFLEVFLPQDSLSTCQKKLFNLIVQCFLLLKWDEMFIFELLALNSCKRNFFPGKIDCKKVKIFEYSLKSAATNWRLGRVHPQPLGVKSALWPFEEHGETWNLPLMSVVDEHWRNSTTMARKICQDISSNHSSLNTHTQHGRENKRENEWNQLLKIVPKFPDILMSHTSTQRRGKNDRKC